MLDDVYMLLMSKRDVFAELVQLQQFTVFMDKDVEEYIEETRKGKGL